MDSQISLIYINITTPAIAIFLTFSQPVDSIIAQAGTIPNIGPSIFSDPYDPIGRQAVVQSSPSSQIVIPAVSVQIGANTTDYYAVVYTNSSVSSISVTASLIAPSTVYFKGDPLQASIPTSNLPQIIHIPFTSNIQVVSVELDFEDLSCVSDNSTQVYNIHIFNLL